MVARHAGGADHLAMIEAGPAVSVTLGHRRESVHPVDSVPLHDRVVPAPSAGRPRGRAVGVVGPVPAAAPPTPGGRRAQLTDATQHPGTGVGSAVTRGSVLVVEDAPDVRDLVSTTLAGVGLGVRAVGTARECLAAVGAAQPDVIVLDRGLPDADGTELCRELRSRTPAYVLMVSTHADEVDVLVGLAAGADGYMAVPFSPRELAARVQAFLRRPVSPAATAHGSGTDRVTVPVPPARTVLPGLEIDEDAREVRVRGAAVPLTRTEFDLLHALATRPGRVLQRRTLLREVWGSDWEGHLRLVEAHMSNLRRKLAAAGLEQPPIRTVRGIGYRLVA